MSSRQEVIDTLKAISIRGRVGFCALCVEAVFRKKGIVGWPPDLILAEIWKFTSSDRLDNWEQRINELTPVCLLDTKFNVDDYCFFDTNDILIVKKFYEELPVYIADIIDYTVDVGVGNLYGGTEKYSPTTLKSTLKVIELCMNNDVELPALSKFKKYSFNAAHGWGDKFERLQLPDMLG